MLYWSMQTHATSDKDTKIHKSKASRNFHSLWDGKANTNFLTRALLSLTGFKENSKGVIVCGNGNSLK